MDNSTYFAPMANSSNPALLALAVFCPSGSWRKKDAESKADSASQRWWMLGETGYG